MLVRSLRVATLVALSTTLAAQRTKVVAWNDLGMHCMDSDYSVFSILPPFNTLQAQVIDGNGRLVTSTTNLRLTYEAVLDPSGSINRSSLGKTNFWAYANALYGGGNVVDRGLAGNNMPGINNAPQPLAFDPATRLFHAEGIPITPFDDAGHKRPYPLMRVVARNATGTFLAASDVVLPVSDEMDCSACHASGSGPAAQPRQGWWFDANRERDYRRNILSLHDEQQANNPTYAQALATAGYRAAGLAATADGGTPILCARCHASNALPGTGIAGITQLTTAMHAGHANVRDPVNGQRLDDSSNRASCYRCHPGSETRCLRGAMGNAVADDGALAMQCQSCHGNMSAVGAAGRTGWLEQPNCQACHTGTATQNSGQIRFADAIDATTGRLRVPANATFATNPNVPAPGFSLYRFSQGHGNLRCEACHGSTHAEYPAGHGNDNLQNIALQGHEGTLAECTACHATMPETSNGGPHGMHEIGSRWARDHGDAAENNLAACRACHGADDRGTVLSAAQGDRTFTTEFGTKVFARGAQIGCYACHLGPNNENANPNRAPVVSNTTATARVTAVTIPLTATDPDGHPLTLRVVKQATHGRVTLLGRTATYHPDPGFAGVDTFTFLARDAAIDSNLGTVTINRSATVDNYGVGYPGTGGVVPNFVSQTFPVLGGTADLTLQNSSGAVAAGLLLLSTERANLTTSFGGALLTEPWVAAPIVVPVAGAQFALPVPNDIGLIGLQLRTQAVQVDAGARFGLAFSRGLELSIGQ